MGVCLTSKWPLHRQALKEERFRQPVDFLATVARRLLKGAEIHHGDVLDRNHPAVKGTAWPGDFEQWLVVRHQSIESRRKELRDLTVPEVLFLIPNLGKPIAEGKAAMAMADAKAKVKWEKPAASGAKNNLVVPLCYKPTWHTLGDPKDVWY